MTITIASTTNTIEEIQAAAADPAPAETVTTTESAPAEAEPAATEEPASVETPESTQEPTETEEPAANEATEEPAQEPDEAAKAVSRTRKKDLQARIDELVRDKYTSQRAAIEAQNEVARLREEIEGRSGRAQEPETPQPEAAQPTAPVDDPEPKSDQFDTFEEYVAAYAKHAARKERRELEAEIARQRSIFEQREMQQRRAFEQQRVRQSNDSLMAAHLARVEAVKETIPDFDDVIDKSEDIVLPPPMQSVILNEEHGPRLMYYLAQHPEECDRITKLAPTPQLVAMGKILTKIETELETKGAPSAAASATVQAAPKKVAAPPSKLPPPPKTVGTGSAQSSKPLDELSYQEFKEIRNREERARMGR